MPDPARSLPPAADAPAATETLYRAHSGWLLRRLRRRFGVEVAEELVQDVWLRLLGRPGGGAIRSPRAFLLTVAARLSMDQARRARPETRERDDEIDGGQADQAERLLLKQIVREMPPPLRDVFLLSRFEGLTYESIAERLGVSVKTVEWRMSKALAHCAARLRD
ncbi:RNA polymerase sigma factor [Brevundimonas staleyi]|uniref:RNA polymerase sigma factor n=1 Tax=Brevundimonas staleyi TaxID=74326 RepID=A0ABW0FV06_9CAUL